MIQPTIDPTGEMSQGELHMQDIQNLLDKVNELDTQNGVHRTVTGSDDFYDSSGKARLRIGQSPDDQRMGIWLVKTGFDVIQQLGG